MIFDIDNARLLKLIPNVIHHVGGETPLVDKLRPWLDSARQWFEINILGPDYTPAGSALELSEKLIVNKAFSEAVPSLDLSMSPAGFAVINTDGRAPASKERVERLIASLNSWFDANLNLLLLLLRRDVEWRRSSMGEWWFATFMPDLTDAFRFNRVGRVFDTYLAMRDLAMRFEQELGEKYLGVNFLIYLRDLCPASPQSGPEHIAGMIRSASMRYFTSHQRDQKARCPDPHEVWHLASPILAQLEYWPELRGIWASEMEDKIQVEPFCNNKRGGYFF